MSRPFALKYTVMKTAEQRDHTHDSQTQIGDETKEYLNSCIWWWKFILINTALLCMVRVLIITIIRTRYRYCLTFSSRENKLILLILHEKMMRRERDSEKRGPKFRIMEINGYRWLIDDIFRYGWEKENQQREIGSKPRLKLRKVFEWVSR